MTNTKAKYIGILGFALILTIHVITSTGFYYILNQDLDWLSFLPLWDKLSILIMICSFWQGGKIGVDIIMRPDLKTQRSKLIKKYNNKIQLFSIVVVYIYLLLYLDLGILFPMTIRSGIFIFMTIITVAILNSTISLVLTSILLVDFLAKFRK